MVTDRGPAKGPGEEEKKTKRRENAKTISGCESFRL